MSDYVVSVQSAVGSDHGQYTVIVRNVASYNNVSWQPTITFTVAVTDPCRISSAVIAYTPLVRMDVVLGETKT